MLGYAAPFACVLMGFLLNNWATSSRAANARQAEDAAYRARVLTHMEYTEREAKQTSERLGAIAKHLGENLEFRGNMQSLVTGINGRLERVEHRLLEPTPNKHH